MLSGQSKIRLALFVVTSISMATSFWSLSYINKLGKEIQEIAYFDTRIMELGENISIKILEARRDEKNFIIYLDTLYLLNNAKIVEEIESKIEVSRGYGSSLYSEKIDSITVLLSHYHERVNQLYKTFQENPKILGKLQKQIIDYENETEILKRKQSSEDGDLSVQLSQLNLAFGSIASKFSADKSKLFIDLKESSDRILKLSGRITSLARESLIKNSEEGMKYGARAQRNTLTLLLGVSLLLILMIYYIPRRIFLPYKKMIHVLKAISRGEIQTDMSYIEKGGEFEELSSSFEQAISRLKYFNDLKTEKIIEIKRNYRRILEEIEEGVLIFTSDLNLIYANEPAKKILNINSNFGDLNLKQISILYNAIGDKLNQIEKMGRLEKRVQLKKRGLIKNLLTLIPDLDQKGNLVNILMVIK